MSKGLEALKVWNAVEKYLNLYHHQAIKDNINVETVEGMPIKIIEKSLKALEIIKEKTTSACNCLMILKARTDNLDYYDYKKLFLTDLTQEEYDILKEVLL